MAKAFAVFLSVLISLGIGFVLGKNVSTPQIVEKTLLKKITDHPLDKYTIAALGSTPITPSKIEKVETLSEEKTYSSHLFSMTFDPTLTTEIQKKITGIINIPESKEKLPIVVMLRGYVDEEIFESGMGTKNAAETFVKNGFITIAPDFLGYGKSDEETQDIMEARFQTYTTTLSLLSSLSSIEEWDGKNAFIWGHSNGGQIALTVLEISQKSYPTTLWAPVSKPFPYSVLFYTDESQDLGKYLRRQVAKFEEVYDPDLYSIHKYYDRIKAPFLLHQGGADPEVPQIWSDELVKTLQDLKLDVEYFVYPSSDHNLRPAWDTAIAKDLAFFKKHIN